MNRRTLLATCILVCGASSLLGQSVPESKRPEDVGFWSERLARIAKLFQADIDKGAIPGATLLVAREGKLVYLRALGYQDREKSIPMKPDAIFRIASMTKPFTGVAVMMLAEEGKIDLLAPATQTTLSLVRRLSQILSTRSQRDTIPIRSQLLSDRQQNLTVAVRRFAEALSQFVIRPLVEPIKATCRDNKLGVTSTPIALAANFA